MQDDTQADIDVLQARINNTDALQQIALDPCIRTELLSTTITKNGRADPSALLPFADWPIGITMQLTKNIGTSVGLYSGSKGVLVGKVYPVGSEAAARCNLTIEEAAQSLEQPLSQYYLYNFKSCTRLQRQ